MLVTATLEQRICRLGSYLPGWIVQSCNQLLNCLAAMGQRPGGILSRAPILVKQESILERAQRRFANGHKSVRGRFARRGFIHFRITRLPLLIFKRLFMATTLSRLD